MVRQKITLVALMFLVCSISANSQARPGRTTGLTQKQALEIAIDCVSKAAGFDKISGTKEIPHYRLEDKLDYLGITDASRLNALRRYLVRNEEVGTQKIAFPKGSKDDPNRRTYSYMLTSHDLLTVKRDWTLLKLAQFIAKTAGYARIPIATSNKIVADCLAYHSTFDPEKPNDNITLLDLDEDAEPSVRLDAAVSSHASIDTTKFSRCVVESKFIGVRSTTFSSTKGDSVRYSINIKIEQRPGDFTDPTNNPATDYLIYMIGKGWTFGCVSEFVSENAQAELPKSAVAGQVVMTSIRENQSKDKPFDKDSKLGDILKKEGGNPVGLQRLISDISANFNPSPASTLCDKDKDRSGKFTTNRAGRPEKNRGPRPPQSKDWEKINDSMTVKQLVEFVESRIEEIGETS